MVDSLQPQIIEKHIVPVLHSAVRLSDYCGGKFTSIPSRKGMKKAIDKGRLLCNGTIATTAHFVSGGETLALCADPEIAQLPQIDLSLTVLYEDDFLAVIHKPAGILVNGNKKITVRNALRQALVHSKAEDALMQPEPAHRLDYATTGCLLIGKSAAALTYLNTLFSSGAIQKTYLCVTQGNMPNTGTINSTLDEKTAVTHFTKLVSVPSEKFQCLNLVSVTLETGRTHQIRRHLSSVGCPILADPQYGIPGKILQGRSLYLHALQLKFMHPQTHSEVTIKANPPKKFRKLFPAEIAELI